MPRRGQLALRTSGSAGRMLTERLHVLDPLCGRGSTLNQTLMYGWHASGVDVEIYDVPDVDGTHPRSLAIRVASRIRRSMTPTSA